MIVGMERMTWIKPSFLWMMYRSGWATKPGQERVLAVELLRSGFEQALSEACLSSFDRRFHPDQRSWSRDLKRSSVRVQWDPERSRTMTALPYRSLQVGLSGPAVHQYIDEWIVGITDVTGQARAVHEGQGLLPVERPYPLPAEIGAAIGADPL